MPQFQYKQQSFQQDAVKAVLDMFSEVDIGQFQQPEAFRLTSGSPDEYLANNQPPPIVAMREYFKPALTKSLSAIQTRNKICPTALNLDSPYLTLDTQMETGTGKTFTFINTVYELHKQHGLTHFVIIVPSIAIKEGIKKSFTTTRLYFEQRYHATVAVYEMSSGKSKKGRKSPPAGVMNFVHSQQPTVLIMTNHAFNSSKNLVNQELEGFYADYASTPMDAIAAKCPVLIIDEPQRVEGTKTCARLPDFKPLFVLRYSATFRSDQIDNLIYVLDSYDAFNWKLVKNIAVTDYQIDRTDTDLLGVRRLSAQRVELDAVNNNGEIISVRTGVESDENRDNKLFTATNNPVYRELRVIKIDHRAKTVTFSNNLTLAEGEYTARDDDNARQLTEIMLCDTITGHLHKESALFARGIKCLSLIFIDKVRDYRNYAHADNGAWLQELFEHCYADCVQKFIRANHPSTEYRTYLRQWTGKEVHGGYFSGDPKTNSKIDAGQSEGKNDIARKLQQEISELILRDKERVLDPANKLRFIFAHSALREGWDNPNVFQICKLRTSYSEMGIVQEVGRGLRICVDRSLTRQDEEVVGNEFSALNRLDVFTLGNGKFIRLLQKELDERRSDAKMNYQSMQVTNEKLREIYDITLAQANKIWGNLYDAGGIDEDGLLLNTEKIVDILVAADLEPQKLMDTFPAQLNREAITNTRDAHKPVREYCASPTHYQQFKALWEQLHQNVIYEVKYSAQFVAEAVSRINALTDLTGIHIERQHGAISTQDGEFKATAQVVADRPTLHSNMSVQRFLNQLAEKTDLPRNTIICILSAVENKQYQAMQSNPFLAIDKVSDAIKHVIYKNIVDNIRYCKMPGIRSTKGNETVAKITLTDRSFKALHYIELDQLPQYVENNLWKEIAPYESENPERAISESALADESIVVFAKIPRTVNIPAPMHPKGINPDFAFVVRNNGNKQLYFVAEAKPTTAVDQLRSDEDMRIKFMQKYFEGIQADIQFNVISNYQQMLELIGDARSNQ